MLLVQVSKINIHLYDPANQSIVTGSMLHYIQKAYSSLNRLYLKRTNSVKQCQYIHLR